LDISHDQRHRFYLNFPSVNTKALFGTDLEEARRVQSARSAAIADADLRFEPSANTMSACGLIKEVCDSFDQQFGMISVKLEQLP